MNHRIRLLLAVATLLGSVPFSWAGPLVSLSANAPDLQQLHIGDSVQFTITLSGLNPGDTLDFLGVDLAFDGTLLGAPSSVAARLAPAGVVPDASGFFPGSGVGLASGLYDDLFAVSKAPIVSNGAFLSMTVTALAAGDGSISFAPPPNSSGSDSTGSALPNVSAGPDLRYTIVGQAIVPEPASLTLLLMGLMGVAWYAFQLRQIAGRVAGAPGRTGPSKGSTGSSCYTWTLLKDRRTSQPLLRRID